MERAEPIIIGHRANSGRIVQLYKLAKVRYVEIDIRQLGEDILVGHGRPVINRATIIGSIWAWLDYKLFFRDPFLKVRTLDEWFDVLKKKLDVKGIILDLKNKIDPEKLASVLNKLEFEGTIYVSVEDHRQIQYLKENLPSTKVLASYSIMPRDIVECTLMSKADGVALRKDYVSADVVRRLHESGLLVFAWTINRSNDAVKAYRAGVDGIITDRPDIVRKSLGLTNQS